MIVLELLHWEGTFTETSFPVAELTVDVVAPIVEATIVESGEAVALAARDGCDVERLHLTVDTIIHLANVLHKHPILQVACPVDAELAL